jgi:hypothetical protein
MKWHKGGSLNWYCSPRTIRVRTSKRLARHVVRLREKRNAYKSLVRMVSSGMLRSVALVRTDVPSQRASVTSYS